MFESFCKEKLAPLTLRLALGLVCIYHGFSKIMVMGGLNWEPALPVGYQFLLAWGEFGAGAAILLGFRCRLAALTIVALIVGKLAYFHGWQMFHLPMKTLEPTVQLVLVGLTLLFLGAGELSVDARGGNASAAGSKGAARRRAAA
jgi:uncharacterized membrane protein YphA (DoxX/SURF4 family)